MVVIDESGKAESGWISGKRDRTAYYNAISLKMFACSALEKPPAYQPIEAIEAIEAKKPGGRDVASMGDSSVPAANNSDASMMFLVVK
jgi:hypothetical protein